MVEPSVSRKQLLDELLNRQNNMGGKKFHSETAIQQFVEEEGDSSDANKDPGVQNLTIIREPKEENIGRRRTLSQPGPVSGSMLTATAARAARKRPQRSAMYASGLERSDSSAKLNGNRGDDSGTATPNGGRGSPLPITLPLRNGDAKLNNISRIYTPQYELRGGATPRKRSVATMDAQSIRSIETHAPPPTSKADNNRQTKKYMTLIMSCIYAIFLVTIGLIIYPAEPFMNSAIPNGFSIALCLVGITYHVYLMIDIGRFKRTRNKNSNIIEKHEEKIADFFRQQEEEFGTDDFRTAVPPPELKSAKHSYCFKQGRHSGSFYLKMGASAFAMGHLVHSVLLITVQIGYYFDEVVNNEDCIDFLRLLLDFLNPVYVFIQLYFIFKYSNVIILRAQGLGHFGFMHMIGSSLCFWISTIVRETVLALTLYANTKYLDSSDSSEESEEEVTSRFNDISNIVSKKCAGPAAFTAIYENFSPYLFPFSVEFNILIVAVYYIIWNNIGNCFSEENSNSDSVFLDEHCKIGTAHENNDYTSNIVIYADCHASNRGLFTGMIVLVFVLGILILGFVFNSVGGDFIHAGYLLNDCTKLCLHAAMLLATVVAFNQTRTLDINEHPISILDDILLFICLPAFFMETVFSVTAAISYENYIKTLDFLLMMIQVLIQTPLLIDGLRRCSNSRKLRRKKPGREVIMFLLIANVGMWIFYTFSYKSPESLDERYLFFGKELWTILGHISLPLIMFYRFHSSVCFSDIWDSAYKPGSEH